MRTKADIRRPLRIYELRPKYRATTPPDVALRSSGATIALRLLRRLDLVAVGVAQERAAIGGMMVVQPGWPVIGAAGGNAGVPERSNV
jgi:hypothetical protein